VVERDDDRLEHVPDQGHLEVLDGPLDRERGLARRAVRVEHRGDLGLQ
jgi:hypothetical protein